MNDEQFNDPLSDFDPVMESAFSTNDQSKQPEVHENEHAVGVEVARNATDIVQDARVALDLADQECQPPP